MSELRIVGGRVLLPDAGLAEGDLALGGGLIVTDAGGTARTLDARGLLVLPGLVDLHGDAFERALQPRPGVSMPVALALADTEAQLLASGITTAYLGMTLSWEPGLRGVASWTALLAALAAARPVCDLRTHLRWEACNLAALDLALADIAAGRVGLLAFNDHTPAIVRRLDDPAAAAKYTERAEVAAAEFAALARAAGARAAAAPAAQALLAAAARAAGLPIASHDDDSPATRAGFRAMGARICEFPMDAPTAEAARDAGDAVVMGSPNVVRGGSHLGWASAATLAKAGVCTVLTSDYHYPALAQAPFVLAGRGGLDLAAAWALVSANPAAAAGLDDRGRLAPGQRADVVLMAQHPAPRVVATIVGGRLAHLTAEGAARLG